MRNSRPPKGPWTSNEKRKIEDGSLETLVDWPKRRYRMAIEVIMENIADMGGFLKLRRTNFAAHLSFGFSGERIAHS